MRELLSKSGLSDIISTFHGATTPATHQRGTQTIDHSLGTSGVIKAVKRCGILPIHKHVTSDHRPVYVDLDIGVLLKGKISQSKEMQRKFTSKDRTQARLIRIAITKDMKERDILKRIHELKEGGVSKERAEALESLN